MTIMSRAQYLTASFALRSIEDENPKDAYITQAKQAGLITFDPIDGWGPTSQYIYLMEVYDPTYEFAFEVDGESWTIQGDWSAVMDIVGVPDEYGVPRPGSQKSYSGKPIPVKGGTVQITRIINKKEVHDATG